jgi:hypothetical protein
MDARSELASMDRNSLKTAQAELQERIRELLGPQTPGISGIGAGRDASGNGLGLTVLVNSAGRTADVLAHALPPSIGGFPVRISRRGSGFLG